MKIKYHLSTISKKSETWGVDVFLTKEIERNRVPIIGDRTILSEAYPNFFMVVKAIYDTLYDDSIHVYCNSRFDVPDNLIQQLIDKGWLKEKSHEISNS